MTPTSVFAYSATLSASDSITLNVIPTGDGTAIQADSINVVSDCRAGYNLTIATPEGSDLYLDGDNTNEVSFTAVDGTNSLRSADNTNKWGYTLVNNPTSATVFSPLSATPTFLKTTSETASPSADIDDDISVYYGVKTSPTTAPGRYQMANGGAIVYYLTMDYTCTRYTVEFNANGGTGTISDQVIQIGEATKLSSAEDLTPPTTTDYTDADNNTITGVADKLWTFWGWNTEADGTGDWYKDREAVLDLGDSEETITLYAQWKQANIMDLTTGTQVASEKVIDHNTMQDMNPAICYNSTAYSMDTNSNANTPYNSSTNPNGYHATILLDYRGKITTGNNPENPEQYIIAKLPDKACWMISDLHLGSTTRAVTLTSEDTDTVNDFTLPVVETSSTKTQWGTTDETTGLDTAHVYQYNSTKNLYNWYTAMAGTTYTSTSSTTSICPKNWKMLTKNRAEGYLSAVGEASNSTNTAILTDAPFNITNGYYNSTTQTAYTNKVYWMANGWRNSTTGLYYGYYFGIGKSSGTNYVRTTYGYQKMMGLGVRCVASQGKVTVNYDGNGSTGGSTASQQNVDIHDTNVASNGFTKSYNRFDTWNTEPDGSGMDVPAGTSISTLGFKPGETVTLYAKWVPQLTLVYKNNCMIYASSSSECTESTSSVLSIVTIDLDENGNGSSTLPAYNKWTLAGWKIVGWSTVEDNSSGANNEYPPSYSFSVSNLTTGGRLILYAHWVPAYTIQYDDSNASNPNGMGTTDSETGEKSVKETYIAEGDNVLLLPNNFIRSGYGFAGWSTDSDAWTHFTDNDNSNDPIIYGPMENVALNANLISASNANNIITLHPVWVPAERDVSNNPVYLQDFGITECEALTSTIFDTNTGEIAVSKNSVIALTDKRDNQVYTVAKLVDGNCWMVENLRLDDQYTMGQNQNDNSVTNESLSQGYGGVPGVYGSFVGLAEPESTFATTPASNSVYKSSLALPVDTYNPLNNTLEDIGTTDNPTGRFPRYDNRNTSDSVDSTTYTRNYGRGTSALVSGAYTNANVYSYGNNYSWAAAAANTGNYNLTNPSDLAGTSICPAGWHLPSGSSSDKEFAVLSVGYGGDGSNQSNTDLAKAVSNRFRSFPNNFVYSGGAASSRGLSGSYWSRSGTSSTNAYLLSIGEKKISPWAIGTKYSSGSVRCLADNTYTIQYDGNGADNPNGMGVTSASGNKSVRQVEIPEGTKVTLLANNYKRAGYGFVGWSTDSDAWTRFTDNDNSNDPTIYGPMEDVVINSSTFEKAKITMYAVWVPAEKDGNNNLVYLQDFGMAECSALTKTDYDTTTGVITVNKNSIVALTDKRDNVTYTIAKLADDKCWMIDNLRLDSEYTMGQNQNDSSVSNASLAQGYGGLAGVNGNFVGLADSESANFSNTATSNSVYKSSSDPPVDTYNSSNNVLEDIGSANNPGYRMPRYNNTNTNNMVDSIYYVQSYETPSSPADKGTNYRTSNIYSYGNYYSWAAAMANTNHFEHSANSESAGTSICPSGWHLPSSGITTDDYGVLSQAYGGSGGTQSSAESGGVMSSKFRHFPNNFLYSGSYTSTTTALRGSGARYWSRSSGGTGAVASAYSLVFDRASLYLSGANNKYGGYAVRCIVNDTYTIQYDGNGADNSNGMGTTDPSGNKSLKQNEINENIEVTLFASNFKRSGYGFAGWSTDSDAWAHFTDNDNSNDPTIYGPMEKVTVDSGLINEANNKGFITMYAVWVPAEKDGNNNPVYLQNFGTSECSALTKATFDTNTGTITPGSVIALTDKRDNQVYTVAKLADNNCWMVENLRLDSEYTMGQNQNDSSVTNASLSQGYGGTTGLYGNFVGLADSESTIPAEASVSNSVYKSSLASPVDTYNPLNNVLEDIGTSDYPEYRLPRYNNSNTKYLVDGISYTDNYNTFTSPSNSNTNYRLYSNIYSFGNYYTWSSAMANTNYYDDPLDSEVANTSICPTNWHLPSSNSDTEEFNNLSLTYGGNGTSQNSSDGGDIISNRFRSFPNNFVLGGEYDGDATNNRGYRAYYWSRSAFDTEANYLYITNDSIYPYYYSEKDHGFSVRCLVSS